MQNQASFQSSCKQSTRGPHCFSQAWRAARRWCAYLLVAASFGAAAQLLVWGFGASYTTAASRAAAPSFATITVNSTDDTAVEGDAKCTLREAINNANAGSDATGGDCMAGTAGVDTIVFAIGTGTPAINFINSLPTIFTQVIIDGGADKVILNGENVTTFNSGLTLYGSGSILRNLVIHGFSDNVGVELSGSGGHQVENCYIGTDAAGNTAKANRIGISVASPNNTIGPGNVISGNAGYGVVVSYAGNVLKGNCIGTNAAGTAAIPNNTNSGGAGVYVTSAPNTTIGGTMAADRNLISGNGTAGNINFGIRVANSAATIRGNYIGTTKDGTAALGNVGYGVGFEDSAGSTVRDNVISGNALGLALFGSGTSGNTIKGNLIGRNAADTANVANTSLGITIAGGPLNNTIGGIMAEDANVIAGNGGPGVYVAGGATGNAILRNSIYDNTQLGIDLTNDFQGVTPNDAGDGDTGANNLQNFPALDFVTSNNVIAGSLDSTTGNAAYPIRVDFYGSTACDPSGHGEGEAWITAISLTGPGTIVFMAPIDPLKPFITATATDANGNTSEFSRCKRVNRLPALTANAATRAAGSGASNAIIGTVSDLDQTANTLTVLVDNNINSTVNGVTVSNLTIDAAGNVRADIATTCAAANASFTLKVKDNAFEEATATLNVTVTANTPPTLTYNNPPSINSGGATTVTPATGPSDNGSITGYIVQSQGTYTGTISVNPSTGVVSISNAGPVGSHTITIRATDNCGVPRDATFTLTVASSCPAITVFPTAATLQPFGVVGTLGLTIFLSAIGGVTPYTFSDPTNGRPPGTTISLVSGSWRLSGLPTAPGIFTFPVLATDNNGCTGTTTLTLVVHSVTPSLIVTTTADENGTGSACSLREAITAANTNLAFGGCGAGVAGRDTIGFSLPAAPTYTINVSTELPDIREPLYLNGLTGDPLFPRVELNGALVTTGNRNGLFVTANLCYLKSLVINRFSGFGIELWGGTGQGDRSVIEDCWIGLGADGAVAGNGTGIYVFGGADINRIVGNVISGNSVGVQIDSAFNNFLINNRIGTTSDVSGNNPAGNQFGVVIGNATFNQASSNTIAHNTDTGVYIHSTGVAANGNRLNGNRIFNNARLGIDLAQTANFDFGVTPNDPGDADTGPNRLQNYPVLTGVSATGVVTGTLNSTPSTAIRLEFFANATCDPSGQGEGDTFLGSLNVTPNASGDVSFTTAAFTLPLGKPFVTAIAIGNASSNSGDTSEFSNCVTNCVMPALTTQPANQTGAIGGVVSFSAAASGTPAPTVQWQVSTDNGATFGNVSGATNLTLTLTNLLITQNGQLYRAVFTNSCGTVTSASAVLTVVNTGIGPNVVPVLPPGSPGIVFASVAQPGNTYITPINAGLVGPFPPGVVLPGFNVAYEITTDALFTGFVIVTFDVPPAVDPAVFDKLRVYHKENGVLVDRTILPPNNPAPNFQLKKISALVSSFSPFVVAGLVTTPSLGVAAAPAATTFGQAATFTASVSSGNLPVVQGSVTFKEGAAVLAGPMPLNASGQASFNTAALTVGTHTITAEYSGATLFTTASGNTAFTVNCPNITVSPASLTAINAFASYSQTFTATGVFGGSAVYSVSSGMLPAGLTLTSAGVLSGTLTAPGTYNFGIKATDSFSCFGAQAYTLVVNCVPLVLTPAALPGGQAGVAYNQQLGATNSNGQITYAVIGGALPNGFTLSRAGALSGTTSATGTANFTINAQDASGCMGTANYGLSIGCPTITLADLPAATAGTAYNQMLSATPAGGNYSFTLTSGPLPPGLNLNNGVLSGTPTQAGSFSFAITATGFGSCSQAQTYSFTVNCPTVTVNPATLPNGVTGSAYSPQTLSALPTGTIYSFAVTQGQLPPGLTLNGGVLSGTPTAAGNYSFSITATGWGNCAGGRAYSLLITGTCAPITVNPATLLGGTLGAAYNQTLSAAGGTGSYTFSIPNGVLPPGLTLDANSGVLSGAPMQGVTAVFTVRATSASGCSGQRQYVLSIACGTLNWSPATLPGGVAGQPYSQQLSVSPASNATFSLLLGQLPPGFTLSNAGLLSGVSSNAGNYTFTLKAVAGSCQSTKAYVLTLSNMLAVRGDFDGDGQSDPYNWSEKDGRWRIVRSSDDKLQDFVFGTTGDVSAPGDYDGDGKWDAAVFRPSNGTWYARLSGNGRDMVKAWGDAADTPVPADYDGDGKTDLAVWRGAEGGWYVWRSSDGAYQGEAWGTAKAPYQDVPVPGDYDGDGKCDLAVFRRGDGTWYIKQSRTGQTLVRAWGLATDVPVPADYDGDGRTDIAVWRGQEGHWYIIGSAGNSISSKAWGSQLAPYFDAAVPGDYDGDGKADVAVCRQGNTWFIVKSSDGGVLTKQLQ